MSNRIKLGVIYVDSGTVFVGDPCYTITGDASNHIATWSEWCDRTQDMFAGPPVAAQPAGLGIGLTFPTMYGDGVYPVYADVKDGRIARVEIVFDDDEEDDE